MGERHAIPLQPAWRRAEVHIFDEVPEALALVLWQGLRHLRAWHQAPASRRAELFHPHPRLSAESRLRDARAAAPELRTALNGLLSITRSPLAAADRDVAAACAEIARWAERQGHAQTAIVFAEAAAVLDGGDPALANHAGRLTRNAGEFARADLWFQRAIGLARGADASVEYTRAQLGYGRLWHTLGDVERARKHYNRGSVAAMRQGLEWLAAEAQHDIFALLIEFARYDEARLHAQRALRWYPKQHKRFPAFAADFAYLLVCTQHFSAAAPLLREAVRKIRTPNVRAVVAGLYRRALAGAGKTAHLEAARRRILGLTDDAECLAGAHIHIGEAGRFAACWEMAARDAAMGLALAAQHGDANLEYLARNLAGKISSRAPTPENVELLDSGVARLVDELAVRLERWNPGRDVQSRSAVRSAWVA